MTLEQNGTKPLMISTQSQAISGRLESNFVLKFDIYWLKKHHYLDQDKVGAMQWYNNFRDKTQTFLISSQVEDYHPYVEVLYELLNDQKWPAKFWLTRTACHFGGWRYWFLCPIIKSNGLICGNRVGILYKARDRFGCRHCLELTYICRKRNSRHSLYAWIRSGALLRRLNRHIEEAKVIRYKGRFTKKYKRMDKTLAQYKDFMDKV